MKSSGVPLRARGFERPRIVQARLEHVRLLSEHLLAIARHIREADETPYSDSLPESVTEEVRAKAAHFVNSVEASAFIAMIDDFSLASAFVSIGIPSFPVHGPEKVGSIAALWVDPGARGVGIADMLLESCEAWCAERGARQIELSCFESNQTAMRFWVRRGYSPFRSQLWKPLCPR